jgi:hypothetical protein
MSNNPLIQLRQLIAPKDIKRGVVVEIADNVTKVATQKGLYEYVTVSGIIVGDNVNIDSTGRINKTIAASTTYWV